MSAALFGGCGIELPPHLRGFVICGCRDVHGARLDGCCTNACGLRHAAMRVVHNALTLMELQRTRVGLSPILPARRDNRLLPPELAHRFAGDIKGSKLAMFDDLGHVPQEEDPARTVAEVKRFLVQ